MPVQSSPVQASFQRKTFSNVPSNSKSKENNPLDQLQILTDAEKKDFLVTVHAQYSSWFPSKESTLLLLKIEIYLFSQINPKPSDFELKKEAMQGKIKEAEKELLPTINGASDLINVDYTDINQVWESLSSYIQNNENSAKTLFKVITKQIKKLNSPEPANILNRSLTWDKATDIIPCIVVDVIIGTFIWGYSHLKTAPFRIRDYSTRNPVSPVTISKSCQKLNQSIREHFIESINNKEELISKIDNYWEPITKGRTFNSDTSCALVTSINNLISNFKIEQDTDEYKNEAFIDKFLKLISEYLTEYRKPVGENSKSTNYSISGDIALKDNEYYVETSNPGVFFVKKETIPKPNIIINFTDDTRKNNGKKLFNLIIKSIEQFETN